MRQRTLHYLFLIALMGMGLAGCKSDVNLGDISVDSKVKANLSLPIGEVSATFGDLIGLLDLGEEAKITIREDGIMVLTYSQHYVRDFHKIDIKSYIGAITSDVRLADEHPELLVTGIPAGIEMKPEFTMTMNFSNVNNNMSNERLDSMVIENAEFKTKVTTNELDITNDDIKKVEMVLGEQFHRAKGTRIELPNFRLGEDILIELDNFTLDLMKDHTKDPGSDNVINYANVSFVITLQTGENVTVTANSGFHFEFGVTFMEYKALFGYFKPGKDTSHADKVDVPIALPGDNKNILPFKDPVINLRFTYHMSMPLDVFIQDISAINTDGTTTAALWDGSPMTTKPLNNVIPVTASYNDSAQSTIRLDKDPIDGGGIDRFFENEIDKLSYNYDLEIDNGKANSLNMKQFRLTNNTNFTLDFECILPFEFKKELSIAYADTIHGISLQKADLDSLAALSGGLITKIDKADLSLYLAINNEIPVDVQLDVEFLDEDNHKLQLEQLKGIEMPGATISGSSVTPAKHTETVALKTDDFEILAKTRNIRFNAHVGDKEKQKPSALYADKKISIKLGVTGDVEALLNLDFDELFNN